MRELSSLRSQLGTTDIRYIFGKPVGRPYGTVKTNIVIPSDKSLGYHRFVPYGTNRIIAHQFIGGDHVASTNSPEPNVVRRQSVSRRISEAKRNGNGRPKRSASIDITPVTGSLNI